MVSASDTTRNLIFIYVESLENSFLKSAPEIRQLYEQGLVFSDKLPYGGGKNIIGAATTISSMVSKTTGMPLLCGSSVMNNFGKTGESFFDSLPGIYDILHQFGYRNYYVQGTPARFGATGPFFLAHGMDELYDKDDIEKMLEAKGETYRRSGPGVADADVFDYAKSILDTLGNFPFSMTVTTIDTHFPRGFLDKRCKIKPANSSEGAYYAAVLGCTSKRIGEFVKWIQRKPFGNNTEIVIAGDHLFMTKSPFMVLKHSDRRFINIYINPKNTSEKTSRRYTSFDSAPTVLETMGFNIEGHRLGFGASLLSEEKTLAENMKERKLVHLLRELSGSIEYNNLFQNKAP
jgi:phosphoglycerol transferase MdoB-like AlkP superfamily enzyme